MLAPDNDNDNDKDSLLGDDSDDEWAPADLLPAEAEPPRILPDEASEHEQRERSPAPAPTSPGLAHYLSAWSSPPQSEASQPCQ